jgi:hypothetical protein
MINFGIRSIFMIDRMGSITENEESAAMRKELIRMAGLEVTKIPTSNPWVRDFFLKVS